MSSTLAPLANWASCRPAPLVPSSATSVPIVKLSGLPLDQLCTPLTVHPPASAFTTALSNCRVCSHIQESPTTCRRSNSDRPFIELRSNGRSEEHTSELHS